MASITLRKGDPFEAILIEMVDGKQEDVQQDGQKGTGSGSHLPELDENGECEHGGDGVTCPPCVNRRKGTVVPEPVKVSYHFVAMFDSQCRGCDLPISKGSWVTRWSDDTVKHYDC